jgi:probable F420-dependent oxidoreductase
VKVRIGISLGGAGGSAEFGRAVDRVEAAGIDSLWLPEMVFGPLVEPFTGMTYALARTTRLKAGTSVAVLPGRPPVLVAKQLATLAGLAPGRVLPVFGLKPAHDRELPVFDVPGGQRAAVFDESLELLRLLLTQESVTFAGEFFAVEAASVGPLPAEPLDIWLGSSAPAGLRRVGRLGDGWLGSFLTPAEARAARETIQSAAAQAGREIDPDHFGISLAVGSRGIPPELAEAVSQRRPGIEPDQLAAGSWDAARALIEQYVAAGLSKFVIRPAGTPDSLNRFIDDFTAQMLPLQT